MKILADESCGASVVRRLREDGYDVIDAKDVLRGANDAEILRKAFSDDRILITEDKDFGQLVFADNLPSGGVILLRYSFQDRPIIYEKLSLLLKTHGKKLQGRFVTIQAKKVRIAPRLDR